TKFGVAKNVTLISVKVCDASGGCDGSAILSGISFVGKQHTKSNNKNTVINMSLGGFGNDFNNAVVAVGKMGVHVVVAAGNDATNDCLVTPASAPNAIAVGATETDSDAIAIFSNFGN
ncbi:10123_t:CDS:2, partial [Racocetra persica]